MLPENFLWVEKYRPSNINEYIFCDENVKSKVNEWVNKKDIPHLLLYGPAGTGKTSLVKILLKSLELEDDFVYINASNENGVDIIREKVIEYAPQIPANGKFKVVVLDESDYLTVQSQNSLKDTIERYNDICRFIFITNNKNKIIPPIVSRCQELHINKIDEKQVVTKVMDIVDKENVTFEPTTLLKYITTYYPDFRKIINSIQQNVVDGKLQELTLSNDNNNQKYKDILNLFKSMRLNEARKLLIESLSLDEYTQYYVWLGNNIDLITDNDSKKFEVLSIIKDGIANIPLSADPEIALSGTIAKIIISLR